jgi:hypothetical protein
MYILHRCTVFFFFWKGRCTAYIVFFGSLSSGYHSIVSVHSYIVISACPQDILQHIHSLMKMRDAARAACVSRSFLRFWRHYPNLQFNQKTLAASRQPLLQNKHSRGKYVFSKARQVLENHSGAGVRRIKLNLIACSKADFDAGLLDGWLRACFAVKPGVADFALRLPNSYASEYSFPYSLLLSDDDVADTDSCSSTSSSIQSLHLASCGFHPTTNDIPGRPLACFPRLSRVRLSRVGVTGDELWIFFFLAASLWSSWTAGPLQMQHGCLPEDTSCSAEAQGGVGARLLGDDGG